MSNQINLKTPNNRSSQDTTADSKSRVESIIIGQNNIQIRSKVVDKSISPDRIKAVADSGPMPHIDKRKSECGLNNQPIKVGSRAR